MENGSLDALVDDVEKTGMSLDDMVKRKGRIVMVTQTHLYNCSMNSLRLSNTSSRLALIKWTS